MSGERRAMLRAYGAELELTPGIEGQGNSTRTEIVDTTPHAYMLQQFPTSQCPNSPGDNS